MPLMVLAGKEYGSRLVARLGGQGADAARRPGRHRRELRAHPPQQPGRHGHPAVAVQPGESAASLGLTGEEVYDIEGLAQLLATNFASGRHGYRAGQGPAGEKKFSARVRIDTPQEVRYYQHGGILPYVLRQLLARK